MSITTLRPNGRTVKGILMKRNKLIFFTALLVAIISTAMAIASGEDNPASPIPKESLSGRPAALPSLPVQQAQAEASDDRQQNFSMRPEAFRLSRLLGKRFSPQRPHLSVMTGRLTIGSEQQPVQIFRRQGGRGERVEIVMGRDKDALTWDVSDGAKSAGQSPNDDIRALIERLVFDSPDQFILAQLRGSSYYTIARFVRSTEGSDANHYNGALWNVVRVDDPEKETRKKPLSPYRLYYINCTTGLIDRIISEEPGGRIVAEISAWADQNGEKVPAHIIWSREGQPLMEFRLNSFAHGLQQQARQ